ncbi:MAG: hypothetical protein ACQERR_05050 [Pseudomonadota bacterium]
MLVQGLTLAAGMYGAYKGHQHQERMEGALNEQTDVLKEQLDIFRSEKGGADPRRGQNVDEQV